MKDEKFRRMIKEIFDEKETPSNLDRKILRYINHKRYMRNMTISIAASLFIVLLTIFFFLPKNIKITEEKIKIEKRIVKNQKETEPLKDRIIQKKEIVKRYKKDDKEFYVVFPKENDILEEAGGIVFYVQGGIDEIKYEVDGELYTKTVYEEGTIVIPMILDEGTHILKILHPYESEIMFYSIGEV